MSINNHFNTEHPYRIENMGYRERETMMPHPVIVEVRQVASNQIVVTYDQPADLMSATNISNYWIRSNMSSPSDIASLGMGEALAKENTIRADRGMITPINNSKTIFVITFNVNATMGVLYILLPCFVNLEGRSGFTGGNWGPLSRNMFIGL
ncbi:hypothetical protein [Paenibacillus xylanexedens]|uniref:hypothetical protein n=1 Tax=Paenibacillus xylanexedens TaxID=528191 RepID=UPI003CFF2C6C